MLSGLSSKPIPKNIVVKSANFLLNRKENNYSQQNRNLTNWQLFNQALIKIFVASCQMFKLQFLRRDNVLAQLAPVCLLVKKLFQLVLKVTRCQMVHLYFGIDKSPVANVTLERHKRHFCSHLKLGRCRKVALVAPLPSVQWL